MKAKVSKILMALLTLTLCLAMTVGAGVCVSAEEGASGEITEDLTENSTLGGGESEDTASADAESGDNSQHIFEDIYALLEVNADKIFSVLAFIGTVVVGVAYKSGLLPLLSDAFGKLKSSIDGVKAEGAITEERLSTIDKSLCEITESVADMRWQCESYEELCRERESMRLIMEGQIDMLYAIFMSSALPQYQKDEIGERISEMREELRSYESSSEN